MSVSGLINENFLLRYIFLQFGNDYLAWKVVKVPNGLLCLKVVWGLNFVELLSSFSLYTTPFSNLLRVFSRAREVIIE